ncbi:MAG: viroplasmin family protein [Clostridium sp.]
MAKKKFYAVKQGRKTGIFLTWDDCKKQVMGYPGAIYKSFGTREEAEAYLGVTGAQTGQKDREAGITRSVSSGKNKSENTENAVEIYVDGSYHAATKEFSYGMVVLVDGKEEKFSHKMTDPELAQMRNVAGEIKGSEAAMQYALDHKIPSIIIYHDYQGIASWCNGDWKANKPGTIAYRDFYREASRKIKIQFRKVKGHSNDKYNDMVDQLAKEALGIC